MIPSVCPELALLWSSSLFPTLDYHATIVVFDAHGTKVQMKVFESLRYLDRKAEHAISTWTNHFISRLSWLIT